MPRDEDYEVLYDWEPENEDDLRLVAGETISVLEKNDHGWWYGIAARNDKLHKGFFPKNYVKKKAPPGAPDVPRPPPRPSQNYSGGAGSKSSVVINSSSKSSGSMATPPTAAQDRSVSKKMKDTTKALNRISMHPGPSFAVKSLAAFDELRELGFTVERDNDYGASKLGAAAAATAASSKAGGSSGNAKGSVVEAGMTVKVQCSAMIWDSASTQTKEFANGLVTFVAGAGQVTAGLDAAVLRLRCGEKATVTCAPSMAYGAAGNPPSVPPNSHVVFFLEVIDAAATTGAGAAASGSGKSAGLASPSTDEAVEETRKLLGNVVAVRHPATAASGQQSSTGSHRDSIRRLVLVENAPSTIAEESQEAAGAVEEGVPASTHVSSRSGKGVSITEDSLNGEVADGYYKGETSSISLNDDIQDP